MNRAILLLLTLGFSLAPVLCWTEEPKTEQPPAPAAEPQPKASDEDSAQLKSLRAERIKVLAQLVEVLTGEYRVSTADFNQLFSAENELCNALLDSTDEPAKRVALLTKQVEQANDILKTTQARFEAGTVSRADILRAKSLCLGVKIKLLRERSRKSPPTPNPTGKQP
jgi:hypothetical protein